MLLGLPPADVLTKRVTVDRLVHLHHVLRIAANREQRLLALHREHPCEEEPILGSLGRDLHERERVAVARHDDRRALRFFDEEGRRRERCSVIGVDLLLEAGDLLVTLLEVALQLRHAIVVGLADQPLELLDLGADLAPLAIDAAALLELRTVRVDTDVAADAGDRSLELFLDRHFRLVAVGKTVVLGLQCLHLLARVERVELEHVDRSDEQSEDGHRGCELQLPLRDHALNLLVSFVALVAQRADTVRVHPPSVDDQDLHVRVGRQRLQGLVLLGVVVLEGLDLTFLALDDALELPDGLLQGLVETFLLVELGLHRAVLRRERVELQLRLLVLAPVAFEGGALGVEQPTIVREVLLELAELLALVLDVGLGLRDELAQGVGRDHELPVLLPERLLGDREVALVDLRDDGGGGDDDGGRLVGRRRLLVALDLLAGRLELVEALLELRERRTDDGVLHVLLGEPDELLEHFGGDVDAGFLEPGKKFLERGRGSFHDSFSCETWKCCVGLLSIT